jgi:hypothetical protein
MPFIEEYSRYLYNSRHCWASGKRGSPLTDATTKTETGSAVTVS